MVLIARIIAALIHIFVFLHIKLISDLIFYYIYIRKKTYMVQKKKCESVKKRNRKRKRISNFCIFIILVILALQSIRLSYHIFNNNIVNLAYAVAIFQNLPRFICMKMYFNQIFITNCY